ncbi:Benzoyl-CoA reductase/2-hydroxyglutaryl-CoA dehydratase subunit, BcrC/BadD/HgdB [Spongiibacter sp. IMCC21906]|uniref:2-hydroxyacyl-CoA dehydratase subunit D n=1 Tax=Spongiibacter sp. IMCC21906 TaxID=1620392 RepID=UPI00062DF67D|nr:2-hydroxyacyl-CoA dehydratase family protein [Spongiibacter sp. IMCC21906]AKH70346.1 Benzoyl-CoA reductase/2-hydroxyglutaryl-CoA dehydratase subunit, BcrC/BadD/HgdB [Spongiibacter sp. IMCC21906]
MQHEKGVHASDKKANRLKATKLGGKLVNDYWEGLFRAKEEGKKVVWYNGTYIPPFFHAHDLAWVHGEAWSAYLAAKHLEGDAQQAGEDKGFDRELCSYARTHIGQALIEKGMVEDGTIAASDPRAEDIKKLPLPDMIINAYPYCSSGQQWDDLMYRMHGKKVPIFNVNIPLLWGGKPDADYLYGQEWEEKSDYVSMQLVEMTKFLEENTGRKFDWDRLSEVMGYIKKAAELRLEAMELCKAKPAPASFFDWIVSIAHVNFLPGEQALVDYFQSLKDEIQERIERGEGAVPNEKYRLFFDGMMNWNKVGWLADKFAAVDATVVAGRYTHMSFWQQPDLIDLSNPVRGMAQNYLICPNNHGAPIMIGEIEKVCDTFDIDGVVCHASRTCRGMTNQQFLITESAVRNNRQAIFFEGDVADESFYKDELLNTRLEAMVEAMSEKKDVA